MTIDLIFLAYNRLDYTKIALSSLLADPTEEFSLIIWDNCSTDGTKEYLSSVNDARIVRKVFSEENVGLRGAVNDLFSKSSAELLGIIPNDFLVTPGWTRPLVQAHADIPELGMIACWHFCPEDFDYEKAKKKIQKFGCHQVLRHPWTGGGAGLVKRRTVRECGLLESNSTTNYWIRMALRGYINGFYFPLIYVEHMDDPRFPNTLLKSDDDLKKYLPVSAKIFGVNSLNEWSQVIRREALFIQTSSANPKKYIWWRLKLKRLLKKIFS
jgi:GT2 family glycosyltransferase